MVSSLLLLATLGAAPAPGTYVFEGGSGTLVIKKDHAFSIEVVGANAHTCSLEGTVTGQVGAVKEDACRLSFEGAPDGLWVKSGPDDACRAWCGARAHFDGHYVLPAPQCTGPKVKATRAAFKRLYDAKAWEKAKAELAPLLTGCAPVIDRFTLMWIQNDLAITQHRLGDDEGCLKTLDPLQELAQTPDDEVSGVEPSYHDDLLPIAKATRANLAICAPKPR